jgi:hypothetical protein
MRQYSILISCDQTYYDTWAEVLLKTTQYHNPWLTLRCHVVNPVNLKKLDFVEYTTESISFSNSVSKVAYLQAARFIAVSKIPTTERVVTLDTDTICTRSFTQSEFSSLFKKQYVLQHPKEDRWLAGLVTFGNNNFRYRYAELLNSKPLEDWEWGRDQQVMPQLDKEFNFTPVNSSWISIGKNKSNSAFLTLKGEQKETDKYLEWYKRYII